VTLPALSQVASPQGWIRDYDNLTLGNNVDASVNWGADVPNPTPRPHGSPFRVFNFSLDLAQEPTSYANAAAVNLFYWCNWMHDKLYDLGFTEAAGNFQDDNFGRGGEPGDRILAYAQFGANTSAFRNNARFEGGLPDGTSGMIWMYLWDGPQPDRDGDFDAEMILHEYTHGLSKRLVGGGVGISTLQTGGLAEGWSDFYALALLGQPSDDLSGTYPMAGYSTYDPFAPSENYYFGIRRYPYSTDMNKNPLTFNDIDPLQFDNCNSSAPFNTSRMGSCSSVDPTEVHKIGEVWCVMLWEARKNLIGRYGHVSGNQIMLQVVTEGMKLCPQNPSFTQARDAILQADLVNNCGANLGELRSAFIKRGMGRFAVAPHSTTTTGVVESYAEWLTGGDCDE
jgi:hypothetical protein